MTNVKVTLVTGSKVMSDIKIKTNKYISNIIIIIVAYDIDYHYSLTSSASTLRYDWFAVCLINIKITIFEGLNMVIKQITIFEASDIVTESNYSNFY